MTSPPAAAGAPGPVVAGLFLHPVKGMAAVPVRRLELDEIGPVGDRRWMVVSPEGDQFLTQRLHPGMALVEARLRAGGGVSLRAEGREPLEVPEPGPDAPVMTVPVWSDRVEAALARAEAHRWLGDVLGEPVRLVRIPDTTVRPVDARRRLEGFHGRVGFADGYPLLLVGEASVMDVDRRVSPGGPRIGAERFRPNVVVGGSPPWAEDSWRRVRVGSVDLALVKPCARCVVTTVDPSTGAKGEEPLATLAGFRRADGKVWVGQNVLHGSPGALSVGDRVEVLETGVPRPRI